MTVGSCFANRNSAFAEEELAYAEIKERANLADEDLIRSLHSLSCAKYKILLKEPEGKTISKQDKFKLNSNFTDKQRRIKVIVHCCSETLKTSFCTSWLSMWV